MDSTPPDPEPIERPLSFFGAAIWTLIAMMLNVLVGALAESGRDGPLDLVSQTACLTLAYSIVLFGVLRLHEPQTPIRHVLALRGSSVLVLVLAVVIGVALSLPSDWLDNALAARFPTPPDETEAVDKILAVTTIGKRIALLLTLGLLQPAVGELFFRGVLFTPLRKTRRAETVIIAAAAFETITHLDSPRGAVSLLAATLVFSWLRGVTGSVIPSILAHVAFFGLGVVPIALGRSQLEPTRPLLAASAIGAVVALFGISILARGPRAALARQRDTGEVPL